MRKNGSSPVEQEEVEENVIERSKTAVNIPAPDLRVASFNIRGVQDVPLVVHRMSAKLKQQLNDKQEEGKSAGSKKNRQPKKNEDSYNEARYISKAGWDGFHAGAIRASMIRACSLVNFKMVLAKLSIFVIADGWDATEPQIPLIRIYGEPRMQTDLARVETGQPYVTVRAAYHNWKATVRIRFDVDQFSVTDVSNLLARVGMQCGLCEGRPNSKDSAGMGWGLFELEKSPEAK